MKNHFYLAILPPPDLSAEIDNLRHVIWHRFDSSQALNSPPHITLIPPFHLKEGEEKELRDKIEEFTSRSISFEIKLRGYGSFDSRTLFIQVNENDRLLKLEEGLRECLQELLELPGKREYSYNPHLTLANRDLRGERFKEAWAHFREKEFSGKFTAGEISLLQHSGKRWLISGKYPFSDLR